MANKRSGRIRGGRDRGKKKGRQTKQSNSIFGKISSGMVNTVDGNWVQLNSSNLSSKIRHDYEDLQEKCNSNSGRNFVARSRRNGTGTSKFHA